MIMACKEANLMAYWQLVMTVLIIMKKEGHGCEHMLSALLKWRFQVKLIEGVQAMDS